MISFIKNKDMNKLPKMKKFDDKKQFSIRIEAEIDEIYRIGRQNGWDVSEIARRALADIFKKLELDLKRPASWSLFSRYFPVIS